jgi:spore coat polysaccharide biosynthesis protein SpsF
LVRAVIQARMSSRRFPGKVLAPLRGRPIIDHVVAAVRAALPEVDVVVATSDTPSDAPLWAHLEARGVDCYRGPLEDVVGRFLGCVEAHPCTNALRICADSPLLTAKMLQRVVAVLGEEGAENLDLITTTLQRTFPKGNNAELVRVETLRSIATQDLTAHDREHLTAFLHRNPERYRLRNVESGDPALAQLDLAIDTVEDLARIESLSEAELQALGAIHLSAPAQGANAGTTSHGEGRT